MIELPQHLAKSEATGIHSGETIAQFESGELRNFIYLVIDWKTRQAAIVDPQRDLSAIDAALVSHGITLVGIFLTHSHHDHVAGIPELVRRSPELPIYLHSDDRHRLRGSTGNFVDLHDGDPIPVGSLVIQVLHTPGHSPGECSYFFTTDRPYLLTGDTVFIRDCGRTDFPGGSNQQMFDSIQRIKALPSETVILPGHHYQRETASTVARELRESPPFRARSVQELASLP